MSWERAARFGRYTVVDWSASARPKRGADSIWIASVDAAGGSDPVLSNPRTRHDAIGEIERLIDTSPGPMVLAVDFSLGFPAGTAAAFGWTGDLAWRSTWRALAGAIVDDADNANNRFEVAAELNGRLDPARPGPFWGCPPASVGPTLTATKPRRGDGWPPRWRHTETVLVSNGHRPFDCWQLLGAGSVGSQSLVGIAALERLRRRVGGRIEIWPFTTGLGMPGFHDELVVIVEVWPSQRAVEVGVGEVRDAAQVRETVRWLARTDAAGTLDGLFTPEVDESARPVVASEEGWVFGVGGLAA